MVAVSVNHLLEHIVEVFQPICGILLLFNHDLSTRRNDRSREGGGSGGGAGIRGRHGGRGVEDGIGVADELRNGRGTNGKDGKAELSIGTQDYSILY